MANEKITAFATAVGTDIKEIKQGLATKAEASALQALQEEVAQKGADTELRNYVDDQVKAVKTEILGDGVPENLDTLKEIADSLATAGGDSVAAVTQKMTEMGQRVDSLEQADPLTAYNQAKA